jgi:fumarylacetoacetase
MNTWIHIPQNSDFSIHNLPYGMFMRDNIPRPGVAIGDSIIDLHACCKLGLFAELGFDTSVFESTVLNEFIDCGKDVWSRLREYLTVQLSSEGALYEFREKAIITRLNAQMCMPVKIGDYTDFYSSIEHATNLGKLFRPDSEPLLPNWRHIPVGYHGRASSIVISGTPITRPSGQSKAPTADAPSFGKSKRLDIELEMAYIIGKSTQLGKPISIENAEDHIFGKVIFNDWSARDIQAWEYVPLGPFLGKNFGSTISPWIVTMEALEPFRCESIKQEPAVLPYLQFTGNKNFDINLEVAIAPEGGEETVISESNFKYMYWNMAQQLAHHTVNGCNVNVGDLMASGTISGRDQNSYGSMIEISQGGKEPMQLKNGKTRTFLEDGDTITIRAFCQKDGKRVGFGECVGTITP